MMANRIGRRELLFWYVASIVACGVGLAAVAALTNTEIELGRTRYPWSQALVLIAASLIMLRAQVSRFHDIGWSGRAVLLMFVPLINLLILLFLLFWPGKTRVNEYGDPPLFLERLRRLVAARDRATGVMAEPCPSPLESSPITQTNSGPREDEVE
jgi:uncharacterized membrane protein YhaH (DUF805 family)